MRYLDPDGRYEVDGHFWTVYLAAIITGRSNPWRLAYSAEHPDHVMSGGGDILSNRNTWLNPFKQGSVHALTGFSSNYERMHSRRMFANASGFSAQGIALHRLGDSYAHMIMGSNGTMYSQPLGHLRHWKAPDKIANRPELYLEYVKDLVSTLGGSTDLFAFNYISIGEGSGGSTEQNSAILEVEIRLREGVNSFRVNGSHANAINNYVDARNAHYGSNYNVVTTEVDVYRRNKNNEWVKTTETRTYVGNSNND